ncbi:haloacid dehalogenase-like hydrolase [Brevibacterium linens]|uniref:haloacid dehalogenase-like hydrolase n=1 Tax=Brevibacterium linens TaxID=1703 RepID=UPI003F8A0064
MSSARSDRPELVVYDLDGVITRKDTFTALIAYRLFRSPLCLVRSVWTALTMPGESKASLSRRIAETALDGITDGEYTALAEQLGQKFASDPKWIRAEAVHRIRRQHAQGARIVIATASERRLAEALLEGARVPYDLLSASLLSSRANGLTVRDHRVGERKLAALLELGVSIDKAQFITDSLTDFPTAEASSSVVLIGASARTRERYREMGISITEES